MKKLIKTAFPVVLILALILSVNLTFAANGDPINEVNVSFTTGQNCNTIGDVVTNDPQPALDWINTWLCNENDPSDADVTGGSGEGGPLLDLYPDEGVEIRHAGGEGVCSVSEGPPYSSPITLGFNILEENNCWHGYAEFGDVFDFQPGFEAVREANTIFPSTGGTQHLTLQVTPREPMMRLDIPGNTQVSELGDIATVTNVEVVSPYSEEEGLEYHFDDYNFWIGITNPIVNKTYEIEITIEIGSVYSGDPSVEIVYMPFIQVKNIVGAYGSGVVVDNSITKTAHGGRGTWTWQSDEECQWNWSIDEVKDANLNGYAFCRVKDLATESHFHLSNQTLHLYDGVVVTDGSQWINGNLFTFTHPGTPSSAEITSWSYINNVNKSGRGTISGSFTMSVHRDPCPQGDQCFEFGPIDGTITVSFKVPSFGVAHPYDEIEPFHYNFEGNFQITGGTGFYQGISGSGTISGTFHDHSWSEGDDPLEKWFDFVMIGKAMFRGN